MKPQPIPIETLLDYAEGRLPEHERTALAARLKDDPAAAAVVARYRAAASTLRTDDSVPAPASVIAAAKTIFDPKMLPHRPGLMERIDRIIATLIFDSRVQPSLSGLRGRGDSFQVTFEVADAEIDLQAERLERSGAAAGPEQWRLTGQVMSRSPGGHFTVELIGASGVKETAQAAGDDRGVFSLSAAPGRYDVVLTFGERTIILRGIEIP